MDGKNYKQNKVMRIDEINAMAEEVYLEYPNNDLLYGDSLELRLTYKAGVVDGYNKAKENYKVESSVRELHQYKLGLKDGYNKAKETLYTKEQLMEVIELARLIDYNGSNDYYMSEDEIIQALKP